MQKINWWSIIGGVLAIIFGFYLFFQPTASIAFLATLSIIFAIIIIVDGISTISLYFNVESDTKWVLLVSAILSITMGILILTSSYIGLVAFIPYMLSLWILVSSFSKLFRSFEIRKLSSKIANYLLTVSILGIIAGIFLLLHPMFTGFALVYIVAIGFIAQGILNVVSGFSK